MKLNKIFLFFIGFAIGFFLNQIIYVEPKLKLKSIFRDKATKIQNDTTPNIVPETTIQDVKKIKILCFLHTMPKTHATRAVHVMETWGRHCDKLLFSSTTTDINLGAIGFNVTNDHNHMWGKVKLMMQHIYNNYINEYDWFFKGDDDTFMIPENMRYLLSVYSRDDPIYFGFKFNTSDHKRGYFSGGSGYVMSRKTVKMFIEKILRNREFFKGPKDDNAGCHIETDARIEDVDITVCLDKYNVYAGDSRDPLNRERFLVFTPEAHLTHEVDPKFWYWQRKYYWSIEGLTCCSNYTIAYHYITAAKQYALYYLTYRLRAYGVKHRYALPPTKKNFSEVAAILDREMVDKKLRGY